LQADAEKYRSYKAKDKERKNTERKQEILSPGEAARMKMLNRDRVRKFRLLKKGKHNQSLDKDLSSPYRTPQALGKAVSKVKKLLPNSPRKKKQL
jgi:hypothetical protein